MAGRRKSDRPATGAPLRGTPVRAGMPPILMIAAGRDHVVPLGFEHLLRDKLRGDGVNVTYVELPWADHAFEYVATGFHVSRRALVSSPFSQRSIERHGDQEVNALFR